MRKLNHLFRRFIQLETASGILLAFATLFALFFSNSPWKEFYQNLLYTDFKIGFRGEYSHFSVLHFINDGLMAIFFLLVSLEIKREFLEGQLKTFKRAILPLLAAFGGILFPALFYLAFNIHHPESINGWAVPTATDIAFSLGVLSLLGSRVPLTLKVFLTALAVIDDLAAIVIIAIFYGQGLQWHYLVAAVCSVFILCFMNWRNVNRLLSYLIVGFVLWYFVLKSGIHATVAGVLLGFTMPLRSGNITQKYEIQTSAHLPESGLLHRLEQNLHPWVAYGVLPIFAFANAGLDLSGIQSAVVTQPLFLGIVAGLLLGKPLGIFSVSWCAIKLKVARRPNALTWRHFWGIGLLGGIGFTMSLFIGTLAFSSEAYISIVRLAVFSSSLLAAGLAYLLLKI